MILLTCKTLRETRLRIKAVRDITLTLTPCARFLEADWASHGHVTRARDCHVVVTRSAAL